jgi:hypothetical protein
VYLYVCVHECVCVCVCDPYSPVFEVAASAWCRVSAYYDYLWMEHKADETQVLCEHHSDANT